jgi:hypothetical protein
MSRTRDSIAISTTSARGSHINLPKRAGYRGLQAAIIMASITMLGSLAMEWRNIKAVESRDGMLGDPVHSSGPALS